MAAAAAATPARAWWRPEIPATAAAAAGSCFFRAGGKRFCTGLQMTGRARRILPRVKSGEAAEGSPNADARHRHHRRHRYRRRRGDPPARPGDGDRGGGLRERGPGSGTSSGTCGRTGGRRCWRRTRGSTTRSGTATWRRCTRCGRRGSTCTCGAPVGGAHHRVRDGDAELGNGVRRRPRVPAAVRPAGRGGARQGDVGYVTCLEMVKTRGSGGSWGKQIATNVFEKVAGEWLMCVHHASHLDDDDE